MMKRALLLLSLLAAPCVATSCKDDTAPATSTAMVLSLDKLCDFYRLAGASDKEIYIFRAGYEGDTATLGNLKNRRLIDFYCVGAAAGGHKELVQLMLDKGANNYNDGLACAAWGGHMGLVQLMLDKGADPNNGLSGAALGGHLDIVQLMLDKGANNYNDGLRAAAKYGHKDVVQLMLDKGATNLDYALRESESYGHTECAELIRAAKAK